MDKKEKHILLVTLHGANIGNRLQNYALQTAIRDFGCEVNTPVPRRSWTEELKSVVKLGISVLGISKYRNDARRYLRRFRFDSFDRKYISKRFRIRPDHAAERDWSRFDLAVTGSDQVWHNWSGGEDELKYFYLSFIDENKRASYAPSFGFSEFPPNDVDLHKVGLCGMKLLSCREQEGAEMIARLSGRKAEVVLDPTLLLTADEWIKIEKKPRYSVTERFLLVYFLGDKTEEYQASIRSIAQLENLEIVDIHDPSQRAFYMTRPDEFVWLVHHANYICTDSFHACVFSILYRKPFTVFRRSQRNVSNMFGRIEHLMNIIGIDNKRFGNSQIQISEEDLTSAEDKIAENRIHSLEYLSECVKNENVPERTGRLASLSECCGCGACAAACPRGCIMMHPDAEGFLHPFVKYDSCVNCGKCQEVCLASRNFMDGFILSAYAAAANENEIRLASSSGGIFPLLSQKILSMNGAVWGAAFDKDWNLSHVCVPDDSPLEALSGSKYLQSDTSGVYRRIRTLLIEGRTVLFSGTGCEINALHAFLGREYENLFTVDVICHGVPSPLLFKNYISSLEKKYGGKLIHVNFRSKETGWSQYSIRYEFDSGKIVSRRFWEDPYMRAFLSDLSTRPSCAQCTAKGSCRSSDLTLGDLWGASEILPDSFDDRGLSLVLIHTEKGQKLFDSICHEISLKPIDANLALQHNPSYSTSSVPHKNRDKFFSEARKDNFSDFDGLTEKMLNESLFQKFKRKIRAILSKLM